MREKPGLVEFETATLPFPGVWLDDLCFLTFAKADDFTAYLAPMFFVEQSRTISTDDFIAGRDALTDGPRYLAQILRLAWIALLKISYPDTKALMATTSTTSRRGQFRTTRSLSQAPMEREDIAASSATRPCLEGSCGTGTTR
jgi:hypothetical protein